jgi:hypothetical protein
MSAPTTRTMRNWTLAAALTIGATSCIRPGILITGADGRRLGNRELPKGVSSTAASDTSTAAPKRKQVTQKEPPSTLVAKDDTRCEVTPAEFEQTSVGSVVFCAWGRTGSR